MILNLFIISLLVLAGGGIYLSILTNVRRGVLLLTVVSVGNLLLEKIIPVKIDLLVGVMVLTGFIARFALHKVRWRRSLINAPIIVLFTGGLVTLTNMALRGSSYFGETATQVLSFSMVMGMALVIIQILRETQIILRTLQVFTATIAVISLLGILAFFLGIKVIRIGMYDLFLFQGWGGIGVRFGGIYEQPNVFATLLVLAVPISLTFLIIEKSKAQRLLWIGNTVLIFLALVISQSRSAITGSFLGLFIMLIILKKAGKFKNFIINTSIAIVLVSAILWATGMLNPLLERLDLSNYMFHLGLSKRGKEVLSRVTIWRTAIPLAFQNPFGYGTQAKYIVGELLGYERRSVHNVFFHYLVSLGWLGFIGIILLAVMPIVKLWQAIQSSINMELKVVEAGLLAGLIGFWVHNLAHSMIHWMVVWVYISCVVSMLAHNFVYTHNFININKSN